MILRLEEMDVAGLRKLLPQVGAAMQERIQRLIEEKTREVRIDPVPPGLVPNEWEAEYLALQRARGDVDYVDFNGIRLRLADGAWYKPDVFVHRHTDDTIELHEVKGFWREAARVRIKVAARLFPWWEFVAVQKKRLKDGGGWATEIIKEKVR